VTAITFLVIDIMGNFALARTMENAFADNVLAIHIGIAQVLLLLEIIIGGIINKIFIF